MAPSKVLHALTFPTLSLCILVAMASAVSAVPMCLVDVSIDEILCEQGSPSDPLLEDLDPQVMMSFNSASKMLTVLLSNGASYSGSPDAGHLLTGLGFNLPPNVSIVDTPEHNSSFALLGGSVIVDPSGTSGIALSQDDWGYANGAKGHFLTPAQSSVGTVLSCMHSDAAVTFAGNAATNATMDAFDYGLQGLEPTPGHPVKRSIRNGVAFSLYLDGPANTKWGNLIAHVQANPVVVSYGSPTCSVAVPEPTTLSGCVALLAAFVVLRLRRRTG